MLKVLLVHNSYRLAGGEDRAFEAEAALLESHGHPVLRYMASNHEVRKLNVVTLAQRTVWNRSTFREIREVTTREQPQIVHVHNTFPLISPAVFYAARASGAAVVHTLHNYRLICPNGILFRQGRVCEDCLGKRIPVPGVAHGCYRSSRAATAAVAAMIAVHRAVGTWHRAVDLFIVPTDFARAKFVAGGIPGDKILVKPHFVDGPSGSAETREYALSVGRLSMEKGIDTLLDAWAQVGDRLPLKIVGDGPLSPRVVAATRTTPSIEYLGWQPHERVMDLMSRARLLIFPSVCYETFGLTIAEAFSAGLPVISSDIGSMASLITHRETGLLFRAGDASALAATVAWALANPEAVGEIGRRARTRYEERFTADRNYGVLIGAYDRALENSRVQRLAARSG